MIEVDQSPIGKTPRSTPATYLGAFDIIRDYFARVFLKPKCEEWALERSPSTQEERRCETYKGAGRIKLEMAFMPDQFVDATIVKGSRYGDEMQSIQWNGKSIADVLKMTFDEAAEFFDFHSQLKKDILDLMVQQGSDTLSSDRAHRLFLAVKLSDSSSLPSSPKDSKHTAINHTALYLKNLYILEEPTIGLHMADCERLIDLLHRLVEQGHTVMVIEHHLNYYCRSRLPRRNGSRRRNNRRQHTLSRPNRNS